MKSHWFRATVAVVAFAFLLACGSGGGGGGGSNPAPNPGGGVGAPIGESNPKDALGSPIKIPKITNGQGQLLTVMRQQFERDLRAVCGGGELCVTIEVRPGPNDLMSVCRFDKTIPPAETKVERHSTIVMLTGSKPTCDES